MGLLLVSLTARWHCTVVPHPSTLGRLLVLQTVQIRIQNCKRIYFFKRHLLLTKEHLDIYLKSDRLEQIVLHPDEIRTDTGLEHCTNVMGK